MFELETKPNENKMNANTIKKIVAYSAAGIFTATLALSSYTYVDSGEFVRIQSPTGGHTWYTDAGVKLKMPFLSKVHKYPQNITIAVTDDVELKDTASLTAPPLNVTFADTYNGTFESTYRFQLPKIPENLETMHQAVKSVENLNGNTLMPFAKDLLVFTATQIRGEDFMQGGQNDFQTRLIDQAGEGKYVTLRVKERVSAEVADNNKDRNSGRTKLGQQFVYKVKRQKNSDGTYKRQNTSISAYGIKVVPAGITLTDFAPEQALVDFMKEKKQRVRQRAKIIEDQENERQRAITAQLTGQRELVQVQNKLNKEKEAAIIAGEKRNEEARLQAERALIEAQRQVDLAAKEKERQQVIKAQQLEIASANEDIEKANYAAAQYEAKAIKETGLAQAKVIEAKYNAVPREVKMKELDVEETKALASVLPSVKLDAPDMVINGGGSGGNVSDLLNVKLLNDVVRGK